MKDLHTPGWSFVFAAALIAGFLALSGASPASANHELSACDACCSASCPDSNCPYSQCINASNGVCIVDTDLFCSDDPNDPEATGIGPIILLKGKNLDLHGKSITCTASECPNAAIDIRANGSRVVNDNAAESVISGPFIFGVDCNLNNGTFVDGITILDVAVGVLDCKRVLNNVIGRSDPNNLFLGLSTGIVSAGVTTGADIIENNYIDDRSVGILIGSASNETITVRNNVIDTSKRTVFAFSLTTDTPTKFENNIIMGDGQAFIDDELIFNFEVGQPMGATFTSNLCSIDHADCKQCGTDGLCIEFESPFDE